MKLLYNKYCDKHCKVNKSRYRHLQAISQEINLYMVTNNILCIEFSAYAIVTK